MANPISHKVKIGTIGELLVQLRLLQYDVQAAQPLKDSGNDLIALKGFAIRCIQVKTTTMNSTIPRMPNNRRYHVLAIVLLDYDRELNLDQSKVYLLSREEVDSNSLSLDTLETFKLTMNRVERLFQDSSTECEQY